MEFAKLSAIDIDVGAEDVVLCTATDVLRIKKKGGEICVNLHDVANYLNLHNEAALQSLEDVPIKQALDLISSIKAADDNERISDVIKAMRIAAGLENVGKEDEIK